MTPGEFTAFLNSAFCHTHASSQDGAVHHYFMDWRHSMEIQKAAHPLFGSPLQLCVWVKDNAGMGTFYRSQHELVFVFKKGEASHINNFELGPAWPLSDECVDLCRRQYLQGKGL